MTYLLQTVDAIPIVPAVDAAATTTAGGLFCCYSSATATTTGVLPEIMTAVMITAAALSGS